jgi:Zn-finger nucleic acid-binding protein
MACPSCDHTMNRVNHTQDLVPVFWCPRCGTIKVDRVESDVYSPRIIEKAKTYVEQSSSYNRTTLLECTGWKP